MRWFPVLLALLMLAPVACSNSAGPLDEPIAGYSDTEESENYNRATLYSYMNGGADVYLEYGFSSLAVRRYARGAERYVVELYEMKDRESASAIYSYGRRTGKEAELLPGCLAGIMPSEIQLARGPYYLVCRNEDPMTRQGRDLRELVVQVAERLSGECGVGDLFARLPEENRVPESGIVLFGPIALNVRPWLASLGRTGFRRGWLVTYTLPAGQVETLLAEYAGPDEANQAVVDFRKSQEPDVSAERRQESVVLMRAPGVPRDDLGSLVASILSPPDWR